MQITLQTQRKLAAAVIALATWMVAAGVGLADDPLAGDGKLGSDLFPNLSLPGDIPGLSGSFGNPADETPVVWSAELQRSGPTAGLVRVTADLGGDYHIYSTTQPPGGPRRTVIKVTSPGATLTGDFEPDTPPVKHPEEIYGGLVVEEHADRVTWTAPVQLDDSFKPPLQLSVAALTCADGRCIPSDEKIEATTETIDKPDPMATAKTPAFRDGDYAVEWTAAIVADGDAAALRFTAVPDDGYHIYTSAIDDSDASTNFVVTNKAGLKVGAPQTDAKVIETILLPSQPPLRYHPADVTWRLPLRSGQTVDQTSTLTGKIVYLACTESSCLRPKALQFTFDILTDSDGEIRVGQSRVAELASAKPGDALDQAAEIQWVDDIALQPKRDATGSDESPTDDPSAMLADGGNGGDNSSGGTDDSRESGTASPNAGPSDSAMVSRSSSLSLPSLLLFGFLGGVVLNFMPCVLPVIGLKVMSFINQGGEDRGRVLRLNLCYIAGVFVVFGLLATLAVFFGLGWGEQFQNFGLRITATIGIFAFALSYLGTWEIPTPGVVSKAASGESKREGYGGAFSKGAFATILATPCSAPLLGSVFASLIGAPATTVYLVFIAIAAGMALPFAIIGFVPAAAAYLPKPGAWMETFKELMAFALLGAVAFFFYQFSDKDKVPVFITLIGVWFGCWLIGRVPPYEAWQKRLTALVGGVAAATAIGMFAFLYVGAPSKLDWQEYDDARLANLQSRGKTVLVDFSAKWCANCLVNLKRAIDTPETARVVDRLGVAAIYADWTDYDPAITEKLRELNSNSIPVLAIYPAGRPDDPIVLRDLVSQQQVIDALEQAGPSLPQVATR